MKLDHVIFREYDIRGVYNEQFDDEFAYHLGKAFASYAITRLGKKNLRLSLGYDARQSSVALIEALRKGFTESGAHVYMLGLVTSPISYYSTFNLDLDGGIMVTGSHNPSEYNGFKISFGKTTIFGEEIQKLKKIILDKKLCVWHGLFRKTRYFSSLLRTLQKRVRTNEAHQSCA